MNLAAATTVEPHVADELVAHLDLELTHVPCKWVKMFTESTLQGRVIEVHRWTDQFTYKDVTEDADEEEEDETAAAGTKGCRITGATR